MGSNDLLVLCAEFGCNLQTILPDFAVTPANTICCLQMLVYRSDTLSLVAKLAYDMLHRFNAVPLLHPLLVNASH